MTETTAMEGRDVFAIAPLDPTASLRDRAALLLIDLQGGHLGSIRTLPPALLRDNAVALATLANLYRLPAILTGSHQPGVDGVFLPELSALLPAHTYVARTTANAWLTLELVNAVQQTGRKTLILAGVATDIGVLLPALSAVAAGYETRVVVDVCGTTDARVEQAAFARMTQAGVILTSWASLGAELQGDFSAEPGLQLMALNAERMADGDSPFT